MEIHKGNKQRNLREQEVWEGGREGGGWMSKGKSFVENKGERNSWVTAKKFIGQDEKFVLDMGEGGMSVSPSLYVKIGMIHLCYQILMLFVNVSKQSCVPSLHIFYCVFFSFADNSG